MNLMIYKMRTAYFLMLLLLVYLLQGFVLQPMQWQTDSPSFTNALTLWAGDEAQPDRLMRLTKPLALLLPLFLYKIGFSASLALLIQQHLSLWLALFFLYQIGATLSRSRLHAQSLCLAWLGSGAIGVYGLAVLMDTAGWAAMLGLAWLGLRWVLNHTVNSLRVLGLAMLLGLGLFIKESTLTAGLFLALLLWLNPKWQTGQKLFYSLLALLGFGLTVSAGLWLTHRWLGYSLLDWFNFNHTGEILYPQPLASFLTQTVRSLDNGWPLLLLGAWIGWRHRANGSETAFAQWAFILTGWLGLLLFPLGWEYYMDRILFMFAPFLLYTVGFLRYWDKASLYPLLLLSAGLNIAANFVVYLQPVPQFLTLTYALMMLTLGVLIIKKAKKC